MSVYPFCCSKGKFEIKVIPYGDTGFLTAKWESLDRKISGALGYGLKSEMITCYEAERLIQSAGESADTDA